MCTVTLSSDGYEPSTLCMQASLFAGWDLMVSTRSFGCLTQVLFFL